MGTDSLSTLDKIPHELHLEIYKHCSAFELYRIGSTNHQTWSAYWAMQTLFAREDKEARFLQRRLLEQWVYFLGKIFPLTRADLFANHQSLSFDEKLLRLLLVEKIHLGIEGDITSAVQHMNDIELDTLHRNYFYKLAPAISVTKLKKFSEQSYPYSMPELFKSNFKNYFLPQQIKASINRTPETLDRLVADIVENKISFNVIIPFLTRLSTTQIDSLVQKIKKKFKSSDNLQLLAAIYSKKKLLPQQILELQPLLVKLFTRYYFSYNALSFNHLLPLIPLLPITKIPDIIKKAFQNLSLFPRKAIEVLNAFNKHINNYAPVFAWAEDHSTSIIPIPTPKTLCSLLPQAEAIAFIDNQIAFAERDLNISQVTIRRFVIITAFTSILSENQVNKVSRLALVFIRAPNFTESPGAPLILASMQELVLKTTKNQELIIDTAIEYLGNLAISKECLALLKILSNKMTLAQLLKLKKIILEPEIADSFDYDALHFLKKLPLCFTAEDLITLNLRAKRELDSNAIKAKGMKELVIYLSQDEILFYIDKISLIRPTQLDEIVSRSIILLELVAQLDEINHVKKIKDLLISPQSIASNHFILGILINKLPCEVAKAHNLLDPILDLLITDESFNNLQKQYTDEISSAQAEKILDRIIKVNSEANSYSTSKKLLNILMPKLELPQRKKIIRQFIFQIKNKSAPSIHRDDILKILSSELISLLLDDNLINDLKEILAQIIGDEPNNPEWVELKLMATACATIIGGSALTYSLEAPKAEEPAKLFFNEQTLPKCPITDFNEIYIFTQKNLIQCKTRAQLAEIKMMLSILNIRLNKQASFVNDNWQIEIESKSSIYEDTSSIEIIKKYTNHAILKNLSKQTLSAYNYLLNKKSIEEPTDTKQTLLFAFKNMLDDYTKGDYWCSGFFRLIHGHANRHHVEKVASIVRQIGVNIHSPEKLLETLEEEIPSRNLGGSLNRRMAIMREKLAGANLELTKLNLTDNLPTRFF